jgi:hypothetical protein
MFISHLRWNRGASSSSRFATYITKSPVTHNIMTQPQAEPPAQPQAKPKRVRRPKNPAWNPDLRQNSLPATNSTAVQGVQSVAQQLGAVSIATEPASSIVLSAPPPSVSQQPHPRFSAQLSAQTKAASPNQKPSARAVRDEKVDPSPASGGIPNPTPEYLRACLAVPSKLRSPQHLLIVIDLNGTLLYRPNRTKPKNFSMRPHAQTFLKYCADTFKVVIWSSARAENVIAMCNTILTPDIRNRVTAIWGRDKFGLSKGDYDKRVQCYKRLSWIWKDPIIAASHPAFHEGYRWDQSNTVLIDDSREKARTEPHNLVEVPEWFGDMHERDDILPQVHDYLNHLSMHSNVSACLQSHPWKPTVF